jgi:hypothetical protein
MTATKHNIIVESGATFNLTLLWKDDQGDPIDLTGCTGRMQIRQKVDSDEYYVSLTTEDDTIVLGGVDGTVSIKIPSTETEKVLTSGVYDLEIVLSNNDVTRLLYGNVELRKNVTR